jgi:hypothetical protein
MPVMTAGSSTRTVLRKYDVMYFDDALGPYEIVVVT